MTATAKKKATYEDLHSLPENMVGEIIDGELIASPRPAPKHARAASKLGGYLDGPFDTGSGGGPGGWFILIEPELKLGAQVMVPDITGWKKERLLHPPEGNSITVAPDWICEIISPSTVRTDRIKKMPRYAEHQVKHAWLIDPIAKTLEVFKLDQGGWKLFATHSDTDQVRVEPFDSIEIDLSYLCWD